ncbi:MAG: PPOX class F420-dependent oxidoreductase [bacterium]|nr:PPOX class F420-dependent oxidoreductase [bacterium]
MSRVFDHIPDSHKDILESECYAHVATLRPDGQISSHPVCLLWDGEYVRFSTTRSRQKVRNLEADSRLAISAAHPENAWHYLEIRGTAELADDPDRIAIDAVAQKYMGQERYDLDPPDTERVTVTVRIKQVSVE